MTISTAESFSGTPGVHVFYDASQRARKMADSSGDIYTLAASSAHVMPASGLRSLEFVFYNYQAGSGPQTLFGYSTTDTKSGYQLNINADGSIEFVARNTTPGNFIDLVSSASAVSTAGMHYVVVTFNSTGDLYALWLDGVSVASAGSKTGTLGTTSLDVGITGLYTNSTTKSQTCNKAWLCELMRSTRILKNDEILVRAAPFRAALGLSTILPSYVT